MHINAASCRTMPRTYKRLCFCSVGAGDLNFHLRFCDNLSLCQNIKWPHYKIIFEELCVFRKPAWNPRKVRTKWFLQIAFLGYWDPDEELEIKHPAERRLESTLLMSQTSTVPLAELQFTAFITWRAQGSLPSQRFLSPFGPEGNVSKGSTEAERLPRQPGTPTLRV